MADDALRATLVVVATLEELGLDYLIGGSLASSLHGIPRSTQDADVVVDLPLSRVGELVAALAGRFYIDEEMARDAVLRASSFNVIHLPTMFKVDLFVLGSDPMSRTELARRQRYQVGANLTEVFVASAEDTILQKLIWYRRGNEVSDRQWQDVLDVLRVQGRRLDHGYLERWADELGLRRLLDEARSAAGQP